MGPGGVASCPSSVTTDPLNEDQSLLLSHQPDELLSFLVDVLSDNQPSSSGANFAESITMHCEAANNAALSITAKKTNEKTPSEDPSLPFKTTATLTARKRNKYRDQMKKELHKQRALVVELEAEVLAFRQGKIVVTSDDRAKLSSAWRRIAKSQLMYRRQAEAENTRLKLELQRTIHITQSIRHLLGDKRGQSYTLGPQLKPRKRALSQFQDADGFEELVVDIDTSFRLLDAVFRESGLDRVTSELAKSGRIKTDKNYGGRQYLELTSAAIEPFDSRMIPDKLWQALVYSFQNGPGRKLIWETEDAFAVRYHPEDLVHQELPRSKLVMKKFSTGSDKIAVVWRASSELTGNFLGTTADETGWVAVQPIADSSGFQSSGSISRSCVHFVQNPVTPVGVLGSRPQSAIEVFSDVILNLSIQERGAVLKMMENLLLDDTIASTG